MFLEEVSIALFITDSASFSPRVYVVLLEGFSIVFFGSESERFLIGFSAFFLVVVS